MVSEDGGLKVGLGLSLSLQRQSCHLLRGDKDKELVLVYEVLLACLSSVHVYRSEDSVRCHLSGAVHFSFETVSVIS